MTQTATSPESTKTTTMQAIEKTRPEEGFSLVEVPVPHIGPDEVLIRVSLASVCGTDLHITQWDEWSASRVKPPMVYGHEFCGTVAEVGKNVPNVVPGDFVSAEMHIPCGYCYQCQTGNPHYCENCKIAGVDVAGCFGEYVKLPYRQLIKLPDSITPEMGACLDSLGNAVHAVSKGNVSGKSVHVVGCGPIGLFAIRVAHALGATQVFASDVIPYRLKLAEKAGANLVLAADKDPVVDSILSHTHGRGCDVVLEMSGNGRAINTAFQAMRIGGTAVLLGIPGRPVELDLARDIIFKAATVIGVNGREMFNTWILMLDMLTTGKLDIDFIITHRYSLDAFGEAMAVVASGESGKILIDPHTTGQQTQR